MNLVTKIHDIAEYILQRRGPMTTMKLQKLVYYSQAWSLALAGATLFDEPVEAWAHGPVVHDLFTAHRGKFVVSSVGGQAEHVGSEARQLIDRVVTFYGSWTAARLSAQTHSESPWAEARRHPSAHPTISCETMRSFYSKCSPPFSLP